MVKAGVNTIKGKNLIEDVDRPNSSTNSEHEQLGVWRSVYSTLFLINIGFVITSGIQLFGACPDKNVYGLLYQLLQFVINLAMICSISRKAHTFEEDFYLKRFRAMRWVHLIWASTGIIVYILLQGQSTDTKFCNTITTVTTLVYAACSVSIVFIGQIITIWCY